MKKIPLLLILFFLITFVTSCSGYKPIFSSSNLNFEIADYSIEGERKLSKQIYLKLESLSKSNKADAARDINFTINVNKQKIATTKDSTGKILEYKITLFTKVIVNDFLTGKELLSHNFTSSSSYKVQDQYSETIKLENKSIDDLLNLTYQDLLLKLIGVI